MQWKSIPRNLLSQVMLFCQYPFEREGDSEDKQRYHIVLQRIINVDYTFPSDSNISKECKDLLAGILVANPRRRLTVQQIQQHPW